MEARNVAATMTLEKNIVTKLLRMAGSKRICNPESTTIFDAKRFKKVGKSKIKNL